MTCSRVKEFSAQAQRLVRSAGQPLCVAALQGGRAEKEPQREEEEAELQDVMDGKVKNLCSFPFTRATLEFSSAVQLVAPWPVLGGPY